MFYGLTKTLTLTFWQTLLREAFQTLRDYNLAWGLAIHARFDNLDHKTLTISRSQICQNHKLEIVF